MQANIWNTFPLIYSDLLGLFLFQFSAYTFKQTSQTDKSSKFYFAFAVRAALNIFTCPFAILLIIPVIFAVKTKRRLCTKSNNSLACLDTTDLTVGLIFQPLTMTNFSFMHIGSRIQTVTCTPINDSQQLSNSRLQEQLHFER